jgi:hypothetical protein
VPDLFRLPRLKTLDQIADSLGRPTLKFLKFFNTDLIGTIEAQERRQDATDLSLQEQIDRINRILAGTEEFTAVNVGGTIVAENAGIAVGVVDTAALSTTAIRPGAPATNAAQVLIKGLNFTGGSTSAVGATTLLTATFDVPVTGTVIIRFTATLTSTNAETLEAALFVDFSGTHNMDNIRAVETSDPTRYRFVEQNDPAGDTGSIQIVTTASLTAGSHTVIVLGMAILNNDEFLIEAGGASLEVFVR